MWKMWYCTACQQSFDPATATYRTVKGLRGIAWQSPVCPKCDRWHTVETLYRFMVPNYTTNAPRCTIW